MECLDSLGFPGVTLLEQWRTDIHGRPWISNEIDCTLSHTDGCVVCAVGRAPLRIGIDVERIRPLKIEDFALVFGDSLVNRMLVIPDRFRSFYRHWTAAESALKADGRGFTLDLERLRVDCDKGTAFIDETGWHLYPIPINPGFCCSLAVSSRQVKVNIKKSIRYQMPREPW